MTRPMADWKCIGQTFFGNHDKDVAAGCATVARATTGPRSQHKEMFMYMSYAALQQLTPRQLAIPLDSNHYTHHTALPPWRALLAQVLSLRMRGARLTWRNNRGAAPGSMVKAARRRALTTDRVINVSSANSALPLRPGPLNAANPDTTTAALVAASGSSTTVISSAAPAILKALASGASGMQPDAQLLEMLPTPLIDGAAARQMAVLAWSSADFLLVLTGWQQALLLGLTHAHRQRRTLLSAPAVSVSVPELLAVSSTPTRRTMADARLLRCANGTTATAAQLPSPLSAAARSAGHVLLQDKPPLLPAVQEHLGSVRDLRMPASSSSAAGQTLPQTYAASPGSRRVQQFGSLWSSRSTAATAALTAGVGTAAGAGGGTGVIRSSRDSNSPPWRTKPYLMVDTADAAMWIATSATIAAHCGSPAFRGVIKPTVLADARMENTPMPFSVDRLHVLLARDAHQRELRPGQEGYKGGLRVPVACLPKRYALLSQLHRYRYPGACGGDKMLFWSIGYWRFDWTPPPLSRRRVDLLYVFSGGYTSRELQLHRQLANQAVLRLKAKRPDLRIVTITRSRTAEYLSHLLDARMLLSPWGYGEYSGKDTEAALAGTVVIKESDPDVLMWPRGPRGHGPWDYYARVKPDFSDLERTVDFVRHSLYVWQTALKEFRSLARNSTLTLEPLARELWAAMQGQPVNVRALHPTT